MKKLRSLALIFSSAAALVLLSPFAVAKAGPEIPKPKATICEAVRTVENHFLNEFENGPDGHSKEYKRECLVASASYTDIFRSNASTSVDLGEWSWIITIVHPRQNDHMWIFQFRSDGTLKLLKQTE
jgi:hypothetical protein